MSDANLHGSADGRPHEGSCLLLAVLLRISQVQIDQYREYCTIMTSYHTEELPVTQSNSWRLHLNFASYT